jgi:hypothetical protein
MFVLYPFMNTFLVQIVNNLLFAIQELDYQVFVRLNVGKGAGNE